MEYYALGMSYHSNTERRCLQCFVMLGQVGHQDWRLLGPKMALGVFLKVLVQCFSMQVVMNTYFLLNSERKKFGTIRLVVFLKNTKPVNSDALPFRKDNVTEPKARLL